eukprot:6064191-Ditylum_brightwellii.AAC.1
MPFVKYCPKTFKYDDYAGRGVHGTIETSNENIGLTSEHTMANHIHQFSQEFQQASCSDECNMMTREEDSNATTYTHDNATPSKSL